MSNDKIIKAALLLVYFYFTVFAFNHWSPWLSFLMVAALIIYFLKPKNKK